MAIDWNADIGEVVKAIFSNENKKENNAAKGPFVKIIVAGVSVVLIIALYVFLVYIPTQNTIEQDKLKVAEIEELKKNIGNLSTDINKAKKDLSLANNKYNSLTKLFHTEKELEDLYRHISLLALNHGLQIVKLEPAGEHPIFKVGRLEEVKAEGFKEGVRYVIIAKGSTDFKKIGASTGEDGEEFTATGVGSGNGLAKELRKVSYYEFGVRFEISGNYANYTKFRKGMAELKKIININEERIIVLESETARGEVKVFATLATYRLPANDAELYINSEEGLQ
jgi:Tfp pilus assembly protein PilO